MDQIINSIPIKINKKDPREDELIWLYNFIRKLNIKKILQIGAGPVSWVLKSINPDLHVIIEDSDDKIKQINFNATILKTWDYEDYGPFDLVYVDSSSGSQMSGLHRDLAIQNSEDHINTDSILIIHDYSAKIGKQAREYCERNNYKLISKSNIGKEFGVYNYPEFKNNNDDNLKSDDYISDYSNLTVVTASDTNHIDLLIHSLPTWINCKKLNCQIIVFYNQINDKNVNEQIEKILSYDNVKLIQWDIDGAETQREKMLSSFIFGVSEYVKTDYWLKLDSDTVATNEKLFIKKSHFDYDMVGQPWSYTKPGYMIPQIDFWLDGLHKLNKIKEFRGTEKYRLIGDEIEKQKHKAHRVISYCRLTKTSLIKEIRNNILLNRMPCKSEDTLVWRYCDRLNKKWLRFKFSDRGFSHGKRGIEEKSQTSLNMVKEQQL